ncbi:MAG: glycoside hydrolase [Actinobacteria bacterium]|nr:MAG: glycoside hydrolase [Actinomycetota bacterium]
MAQTLAVHGHFYQPPRENPWTEEVAREASAAPFHDWNERIAAEAYWPNAAARILDDAGRVVAIVNNYERLSFDAGPTLMAWLERHEPETYAAIVAADARGGGAMAQAHGHIILPLATARDVRTQVRWGLADFAHRFGRPAEGMWLPETAVNDEVLAILAEEGVAFTILASHQAGAELQPIDTSRAYRWPHPDGSGRSVALVFYDGGLSHAVAFELAGLSSRAFLDRVTSGRQGLVTVAADGETFGHHQRWGERFLAHSLAVEATRRGVEVANVARHLADHPAQAPVSVRESSWSCAHGVGRWREDCGCSTGGQAGWDQRWRAPLRKALDGLRDHAAAVFERRGPSVLADPWAARDAYISVLLGAESREEFATAHMTGDRVVAFTLLEAQRHAMAMYTSCGWFFNDLAGLETVQVLRYAARVMDLLRELDEDPGEGAFLEVLDKAESNVADEGTGREVWARHVVPARVDADRAVAHLALVDLLEGRAPAGDAGAFAVHTVDHARADRGAVALSSGHVALTHRRTGRRTEHLWAALHLGGLEVVGSTCAVHPGSVDAAPAPAPPANDALDTLRRAFDDGAPVTTLLRMVGGLGPREFDLRSALPDAAEQLVERAAGTLSDRFAAAYERLVDDHWHTLNAFAAAGHPLPPELRAPTELVLARRLEAEILAQRGSLEAHAYTAARRIAQEARGSGFAVDTPRVRAAVSRLLLAAVTRAVEGAGVDEAVAVLGLARELQVQVPIDRAQELVYAALTATGAGAGDEDQRMALRPLATALNLAVD